MNPLLAVALFAAPILIGWPELGPEGLITPDGIDHVNIARNLARGRGFVHSIKWQYFDDRPIIAPAWGERMPMYSLFLTPLVAAGLGPKGYGAANLALLGLASAMAGAIAWRLSRRLIAAACGFAVGLAPPMLFTASLPLTEPLFLVFMFLSLGALVWFESEAEKRARDDAAAGSAECEAEKKTRDDMTAAVAALAAFAAYLTRSSGIALPAAALLWLAWRREWRRAAAYALAFAIPYALWSCALKMFRGSYSYNMQNFHMVCGNFAAEIGQSYGRKYPAASAFFVANAGA
ncbi:MAG: hypothetical protein NTW86_17665, partial [Candidatus Sumerlaeota bacterium]|nr:hypothetical protein [Candidatus Sumerlaeota bacterium]